MKVIWLILVVALIAVIVSGKANTVPVIGSFGAAFSNAINSVMHGAQGS